MLVFAAGGRLPFDLAPLRGLPYELTTSGLPADAGAARAALVERLVEAREAATDSPIFSLVDGLPAAQLDREKTDVFRDQVRYSTEAKERLAQARGQGVASLEALERELEPIADVESGIVVDLYLSYRAVEAYPEMIALVERMSAPLASTALVQEQLGFALNRDKQRDRAERVLKDLSPGAARAARPTASSAVSTRTSGRRPSSRARLPSLTGSSARRSTPT